MPLHCSGRGSVNVPGDNFRILSLDGGGAKGFYTLGVLREVEGMVGKRLHEHFDLMYGTSTGSIIASLLGLGLSVDEVIELYEKHVVKIVSRILPRSKSAALKELSDEVFADRKFDAFKTKMGIVATRWYEERPLIFKTDPDQAHGGKGTFLPGFGCTIADAVRASCSAYPFFHRVVVKTGMGETIDAMDGGYCANNPHPLCDRRCLRSPQGTARQDPRAESSGLANTRPCESSTIRSGGLGSYRACGCCRRVWKSTRSRWNNCVQFSSTRIFRWCGSTRRSRSRKWPRTYSSTTSRSSTYSGNGEGSLLENRSFRSGRSSCRG